MKYYINFISTYKAVKRALNPPFGGWGGIFLLLLLPSCIETLDIDSKNIKPKIILNGIIEADSAITVIISKTYPFTNDYYANLNSKEVSPEDRKIPNLLPNATPKLYINGEPMGNLRFVKNDSTAWRNGSIFRSSYRPKIGDKVQIEVSAQGFESVWAETVIPQPILINQVDTSTYIYNNSGSAGSYIIPDDAKSLNMRLIIEIENPQKEKAGYYSIEIYQEWIQQYYEYLYDDYGNIIKIPTNSAYFKKGMNINKDKEPLLSNKVEDELLRFFLEQGNPQGSYYFTDNTFTNKRYKMDVSVWGYYFHQQYQSGYQEKPEIHSDPLNIEIRSMSPEMYQAFYRDYSEMDVYIRLLSEPKTTFSNVHNGAGILGSFSKTKKVVKIPKYTGKF